MNIRPTPSGFTPRPGPGRTQENAAVPPARSERGSAVPAGDPAADRVELSAEARDLNAREANGAPGGALAPERLRAIAARMGSGYYERPEVIDRVIDKILDHLAGGDSI